METLKDVCKLTAIERRVLQNVSPDLYAYDIAIAANADVQSVYRTVRKFGLEIKRFKSELTEEQKETIREMAGPNVGVKAIQQKIGCTKYLIVDFLEEEGLPRKTNQPKTEPKVKNTKFFDWENFKNRIV